MSFAQRFSIRSKIYTALLFILGATAILGGFAIDRLGAVNDSAAEPRDNWLPSTQVLGEIALSTTRIRQLEASFAMVANGPTRLAERDAQEAEKLRALGLLTTYERLVSSSEEGRLFQTMKQLWSSYVEQGTRFRALVEAGDVAEATLNENKVEVSRVSMDLRIE